MAYSSTPLTKKQRVWLKHLNTCQEQKLSLAAYARQNQLDVKYLYRWKHRLLEIGVLETQKQPPLFAQVKLEPSTSATVGETSTPILQCYCPNGVRIDIGASTSSALLERLIQQLMNPTC